MIYPVSLRTDSLAVRRTNPDKYYMVDTGIIRAMTPKNDEEKGWLLENLVFMQLRRGNNKIEYYIDHEGGEVDFLVTDQDTMARKLIQVAWKMEKSETEIRELKALRLARDEIEVVPIWKFCLE